MSVQEHTDLNLKAPAEELIRRPSPAGFQNTSVTDRYTQVILSSILIPLAPTLRKLTER